MAFELLTSAERPVSVTGSGQAIVHMAYHEKLNIIMAGDADGLVYVLDATLGDVLYSSRMVEGGDPWDFSVGNDRVAVVTKGKLGIRSDYNGILLLDTFLQSPVTGPKDKVEIELSKAEAELLCQSLSIHNVKDANTTELIGILKMTLAESKEQERFQDPSSFSVKREKWNTIQFYCVPESTKAALLGVVTEQLKRTQYNPLLSVASSVLERLNALLPPADTENDTSGTVDKSAMCSESSRLNTFLNWPHRDYKWAHPVKMAQAGFYHSPSSTGEDRAMCFTCNVCLVSWEPTDEPWSEHERHSPYCPFVRGEHTHNVPLSLAYSTAPAISLTKKVNETPTFGKSTCSNAFPVCYSSGLILIWETVKQPKEIFSFEMTLSDLQDLEPMSVVGYSDIHLKPKEAWVNDISTPKPITFSEAECAQGLDATRKLSLSKVALISSSSPNPSPPSLITAGSTVSWEGELIESWILVFGLSPSTFTAEDDTSYSDSYDMDTGGTKKDMAHYEDELFGQFLSESDMVSDSVTVFSESNMSESSSYVGQFPEGPPIPLPATGGSPTKPSSVGDNVEKPGQKVKSDSPYSNVMVVQKLLLPAEVKHCTVKLLEPTPDKSRVIVVMGTCSVTGNEKCSGAVLVYQVVANDSNTIGLSTEPLAKLLTGDERGIPVDSCFVADSTKSWIAFALADGTVKIFNVADLALQYVIQSPEKDPIFTSVVYCSSMENLWCGTSTGHVYFYSIILNDSDDEDGHASQTDTQQSGGSQAHADLILNKPLNTASLQQLRLLTKFENVKLPFSVNAPSCWQRVIQAQKERKHPLHLHNEADLNQSSFSWRLQRNKESKKEHLFEITFPKTANVGHIDFKFFFQSGCTTSFPFEVTLYMARNIHTKRGHAQSPTVDRGIDFGPPMSNRSSEFLKSANAEVVCGPLQLGNHLDSSIQGGTLVMTSPALLLSKGHNFYLHLKSTRHGGKEVSSKEQNVSPPKKKNTSTSKYPKMKSSSVGSSHKKFHPFMSKDFCKAFSIAGKENSLWSLQSKLLSGRQAILEEMEKKKEYEGCDWLHEISITVRQIKECPVQNSELERKAMLTSPEFIRRLLQVVTFGGAEVSYAAQSIALDILNWIAGIKLCGPQLGGGSYQLDFVDAIEQSLPGLILKCILLADRSIAHKCAKLLVLCFDVIEVYHKKSKEVTFLDSLLKNLLTVLPFTLQCSSAGALQWYFLLLNQARIVDPSLVSESMLEMLNTVSKELLRRTDPLHTILRSRFGLYGTPFDPDLFDVEVSPIQKTSLSNISGANTCGHDGSGPGFTQEMPPPTSISKDIDFRDLLLGNPLRQSKYVVPKQQIHGLIEVEPLHFTCHAASDGARVEKLDSGGSSFSPITMPQHWETFTNVPTGEGSKKSVPYKNLSKLDKMKMIDQDSYYEYLNDVKMLEGNLNLIDMMTFQTSSSNMQGFSPHGLHIIKGIDGPIATVESLANPSSALPPKLKVFKVGPKMKTNEQTQQRTEPTTSTYSGKGEEGFRLLMSPWQQMMYVPTQQALVIDRMHSGARRFVVLDFGCPVLLTDLVIPPCSDLASLSVDMWLKREETDGQRLVVAADIAVKALVINDIQPPPICRYLKIITIGRYGMGTSKCKIPLGMFYGHSAILPGDIEADVAESPMEVPILFPANTPAHLSILGYVLEDLMCRYQLACGKLKRLLEPLAKPEIASIDHISYFLPKGKERAKLGFTSTSDQIILSSYQDCVTLQEQLNVTRNVILRLQRSLEPYAAIQEGENPMTLLPKVSTDKVRLLSTFLVESLLGISSMSSSKVVETIPYPLYSNITQTVCSDLFQNTCVLENSQVQHVACTFLLRVCGFQSWWGNFLTSMLKKLFSSSNTSVFPQDRVFTLLVYLSQQIPAVGQKSTVVESTMKLLEEIVTAGDEVTGFARAKIDVGLLGWTVMFLCLSLDGMSHSVLNSEDMQKSKRAKKHGTYISSRWNFIQGETVLHESLTDTLKSSSSTGLKRRMPKKSWSVKQNIKQVVNYNSLPGAMLPGGMFGQIDEFGTLVPPGTVSFPEPVTNKYYKSSTTLPAKGSTSSKNLQELLLGHKDKRVTSPPKPPREGIEVVDVGINLNLNPGLCYSLTKALGSFLLKMDSTCHSDIYLLLCKALARVATSCKPAMRLGEIFNASQILRLVQTGVGKDFVEQVNWSSSWISHAILCLILDLLDGEKLFPDAEKIVDVIPLTDVGTTTSAPGTPKSKKDTGSQVEPMDALDSKGENEVAQLPLPSQSSSATTILYSDSESDYEAIYDEFLSYDLQESKPTRTPRQITTAKDFSSRCTSGSMSAIDSRMDGGIDSSIETRLRMIKAQQAEVVAKSLAEGTDVPVEVLRNVKTRTISASLSSEPVHFTGCNSMELLSSCFDELFRMMANENCTINIEKTLLYWLSINTETRSQSVLIKPKVCLSSVAISGLIAALSRNVGIGVEDWGLGLKCLALSVNANSGFHLDILRDPNFPELILKFISGSGMNLMRNHVPAMGPTVCDDFDAFFNRLFVLCNGTSSTNYILEVLLRVLSEFLSDGFSRSEFPLDAFNKFLDLFICREKQLSNAKASPAVLISIVDHLSHALYLHVCFPNKIVVKSNAELKGAPPPATTASGVLLPTGSSDSYKKPNNMESLLVRLLSMVSDIITFDRGGFEGSTRQKKKLEQMNFPKDLGMFEEFVEVQEKLNPSGTSGTIADLVVQMDKTMMRLFSVLANPKGKSNLLEEESSLASTYSLDPLPLRIPDFMIRLISRLMSSLSDQKQIVQPLFKFLTRSPNEDYCCPLIVSQMFIRTILKVIKDEANLQEFIQTNCIQSVCEKLVASSKQFFSSCPTFASILMHYIGRAESTTLFGPRRLGEGDLPRGVVNVAPLGAITAVNFSAHPSEVLLQATPPHRRARAPVWSYHFYPEETYLELIVTLPCAVLLKEIQIVPHSSSMASKLGYVSKVSTSSPSAVMIEISKERGGAMVAMSPPVHCSGMTSINIQLSQPEVGQSVLLRLYKPKDSSTLGLSQIKILGCTTFCESAYEGLSQQHLAKNIQPSAQWMIVLDHAITAVKPELRERVIEMAVKIPDILQSCYSMLMCPTSVEDGQDSYLPHVSSVLFHFGCLVDINERLMDALLGPVQLTLSHGMIANTNIQSVVLGSSQLNTVVELIYKLCCAPLAFGGNNLATVIHWLEKCADETVLMQEPSGRQLVPEYVQSVAAALWHVTSERKVDMSDLVTAELLVKLLKWSKCLNLKSELKASVDHMLCSMCYCKPWLLAYLNYEMGFLEIEHASEELNEDDTCNANLIMTWYEENSIWDHMKLSDLKTSGSVSSPFLMTLARASESEAASEFLFETGLLTSLNQMIMDFLKYHQTVILLGIEPTDDFTPVSTQQVIAILEFYGELCSMTRFKDWFGTEGAIFWHQMLHLLSGVPSNLKAARFGSHLYELEYMVIQYLARCCWSHAENQKFIAACLSEMIMAQKPSPHKTVFLHSLSSFCRRLLIQVLLENEKMVVQVKNFTTTNFRSPVTSLPLRDRHPSMGVNGKDRIFLASIPSTAFDLMKLLDPSAIEKPAANVPSLRKDVSGTYTGISEPIPTSELLYPEPISSSYSIEEDVLQEILGYDTAVKMGMKAKNARGEKPQEVVLVLEPEVYRPNFVFEAEEFPDVKVPLALNLSKVKATIREQNPGYFLEVLVIVARNEVAGQGPIPVSESTTAAMDVDDSFTPVTSSEVEIVEKVPDIFKIPALPTTVEVFCRVGGFSLLAKHLPVVYPDTLRQMSVGSKGAVPGTSFSSTVDKSGTLLVIDSDWVKVENTDEYYEENDAGVLEGMVTSTPVPRGISMKQLGGGLVPGIPPHSMAAFGLFLGLPTYAEILLRERVGAQCILRLAMGVTDDADGNDIFCSAHAKTLPTLPFQVLRRLLDILPLGSDEGKSVRQAMFENKAIHFILACLAIFTHQTCVPTLIPSVQHELVLAATKVQGEYPGKPDKSDDKSHVYWAKGTGFGTGSTQENWNVERAMEKRVAEEENVTCLLLVLSSYISPHSCRTEKKVPSQIAVAPTTASSIVGLPSQFEELLQTSCLFTTISLYLKNDSVLDMARHIPLYTAVLQFLRSLLNIPQLVPFLDFKKSSSGNNPQKISTLLHQMKTIVDSYSKRLANNAKKGANGSKENSVDELHDEGLAKLIEDIQSTANLVEAAVAGIQPESQETIEDDSGLQAPIEKTLEDVYLEEMKKLQFSFYEMLVEDDDHVIGVRFTVPHFYENSIKTNWSRSAPARLKRLAQESITLSTSLPIAYGSTIFVRCDSDRLDVMKVLITGPAGTPYSNGCFEFDVYFPMEYPNGPMLIHLQTTGRQRIRFNPNLYADGKVCLSILNTWHGRPEEKWNPQTSSLLPVLVAIQSLILNAEPYFNEPGYEKSRGTDGGEKSSREYNAGIQIATLEWAMLDQIRHPSECFKEVIHKHFWLKRTEILAQCEQWYEDLITICRNDKRVGKSITGNSDPVTVFKNNLSLLRKELENMSPPSGLEQMNESLPQPADNESAESSTSSNSVFDTSTDATSGGPVVVPPPYVQYESGSGTDMGQLIGPEPEPDGEDGADMDEPMFTDSETS